MKVIHQIVLGLNGLVSLYFLYMAAMHTYVYFANKSLGHTESFSEAGRYIVIALIFLTITLLGWFLMKNPSYSKLGTIILYIPIIIAGIFGLWTIIMLLSANGRWN